MHYALRFLVGETVELVTFDTRYERIPLGTGEDEGRASRVPGVPEGDTTPGQPGRLDALPRADTSSRFLPRNALNLGGGNPILYHVKTTLRSSKHRSPTHGVPIWELHASHMQG